MSPPPRIALARLTAALLAFYAAAVLAPPAHALDEQSELSTQSHKTLTDYFADLEGESDPDRLYAARVLRGELSRALRTEATAREGSLASLDARAVLLELETRLPQGCRGALQKRNSVAPCADILRLLGVKDALPELRAVLEVEQRKWVRKHLDKAIAELGA